MAEPQAPRPPQPSANRAEPPIPGGSSADPQLAAPQPLPAAPSRKPEIGGPKGPEPTRYGDWEKGGRCIDF